MSITLGRLRVALRIRNWSHSPSPPRDCALTCCLWWNSLPHHHHFHSLSLSSSDLLWVPNEGLFRSFFRFFLRWPSVKQHLPSSSSPRCSAKKKKKQFSSLSMSSPPPPSSSIYYMIQLVSHQIKGHSSNQSFENIHLISLCTLPLDVPFLAARWPCFATLEMWEDKLPDLRNAPRWSKSARFDWDADIGVRAKMTRVCCRLSKLNLSDGMKDRVSA